MEPLHIFFHVAVLGRWSSIYDEVINALEASGILRNAVLHISVVGEGFNKDVGRYSFTHQTNNTAQYEYPTLKMLHEHCKTHEGAVLYLHTKGATRYAHTVDHWRNMMLHFTVKKWQTAIHYLHEYDAVGCNLQHSQGKQFFSGNFWWAGAKYIKSLPDPNLYISSRVQAEMWIGMNNRARFMNLHASRINHYMMPYSPEKYINL